MNKFILVVFLFQFQLAHSQSDSWQHFSSGSIRDIQVVGDTAWVLTIDGLYAWNQVTNQKHLFNRENTGIYFEDSRELFIDKSRRVWLTYIQPYNPNDSDVVLSKFEGNQWQNFTVIDIHEEAIGGIRSIRQASNGKLYFAVDDGFVSYNNSIFVADTIAGFNQHSNHITCMEIDRFDRIWLGATTGYFMFDGVFHDYALPGFVPWFTQPWIYSGGVNAIAFDKYDVVWIGSGDVCSNASGLYKHLTNGSVVSLAPPYSQQFMSVYQVKIDTTDAKWVFTNGSLFSLDGSAWTSYTGLDTIRFISKVYIDEKNNKWFTSQGGDLFYFNNQAWSSYRVTDCPMRNFQFNNIAVDSQNNMYFGSQGTHELMKYNGVDWTRISVPHNLSMRTENYFVTVDKSDKIWVSTSWDSLMVFDGLNWTVFNRSNSPLNSFSFYDKFKCDDQNRMWFVSCNSIPEVYCYDNGVWTTYNFGQLFSATYLHSIETGNGKVWIQYTDHSYNDHIVEFDGINWTSRYWGGMNFIQSRYSPVYGLLEFDARAVYSDLITTNCNTELFAVNNEAIRDVMPDDSTLWIVTHKSLYKYTGTQVTKYDKFNSDFHGTNNICGALDKNGNVLVGSKFLNIFSQGQTIGINEEPYDVEISIYPESDGKYVIHASENIKRLSIFDVSGKLIRAIEGINANETSIDLSLEREGIYLIEVIQKDRKSTLKVYR